MADPSGMGLAGVKVTMRNTGVVSDGGALSTMKGVGLTYCTLLPASLSLTVTFTR